MQAVIVLDGDSRQQVFAEERSFPETVDACAEAGGGNDTRCNCGNRRDWPCPNYEPVDDGRRGRPNRLGERVRYFTPDLFMDAADGAHAARVTYTP